AAFAGLPARRHRLAGRAVGGGAVAEEIARLDPVLGVAGAREGGLEDVVVVVLHHRRVLDGAAAGPVVDDGGEHAGLVGDARLDLYLPALGAGLALADPRRRAAVGQ